MSVSYPPAAQLPCSRFVVNTNPDSATVVPPTTYGPNLSLTGTAPTGGGVIIAVDLNGGFKCS